MTRFGNQLAVAVLAAFSCLAPALSAAQDQTDMPLPERRIELLAGFDLPGGDLGPAFDTTLRACVNACLNLETCQGLTFNANARACFPKDGTMGAASPFAGALSGRVIPTQPERQQLARSRAEAASAFLSRNDLEDARLEARMMGSTHPPGDDADPEAAAARAEALGDIETAIRMAAVVTAQRDHASDWNNLARLALHPARTEDRAASQQALRAAINGYLRASDNATAAVALSHLAQAQEQRGNGRAALAALRLAAQLAPENRALAEALEQFTARHGLRVSDTEITTTDGTPRYCAIMSRPLDAGVDYADFLRLPAMDLAVSVSGSRLCLTGFDFGQSVELTLRAGLPAADGDRLTRDITLRGYIRDRAPAVRFPGRAYVLPAGGDQGLGVTTVNAQSLDLTLLRLSDRNLLRSMSEGMFARPLNSWESDYFQSGMASIVWQGTADLAQSGDEADEKVRNTEVTTRLPVSQFAGQLEPGIYILQAAVTGQDSPDSGLAAQWFVISDFGISSYAGTNGLAVAVRSLATTAAHEGAEVALISRANEVLARVETDDQGIARFAPGFSRGNGGAAPALLTVTRWTGEGAERRAEDISFLSLTDPGFDLSDRGVEGQPPAPPIDIFTTTDRGAYRAGETVNATILARDSRTSALPDLPLTVAIHRPDGVEQVRMPATHQGGGGHIVSWALPGNAPRGTWRLDVRAEADGPTLASARILVEDFLPERIDFTPAVTIDGDANTPARAGGTIDLALDARWLFGAPAADLPVEGTLWLAPARQLDRYPGYDFARHDSEMRPTAETIAEGITDAAGHFAAEITLPDPDVLGQRPVEARVVVNIREGAGRPVERKVSRLVMPEGPAIGIRPMFDHATVAEGSDARFEVIAVGPDLQSQAAELAWTVNRVETRYEWYSLDGSWQWEAITSRQPVAQGVVSTAADSTSGPAETVPAKITTPVEWGSYELIITAEGGASSSTAFYAGWGVAASDTDTPDRLSVALDQPAYRSGDIARVTVNALAEGTGIISVLSNQVISMQMVSLSAGENTIELPVSDEWGAGVYVTVSALRPIQGIQPGDRMPARALGLAHAGVDPGERAIHATIDVPAEVMPRQDVTVTLRAEGAAPGDTIYATVAAVDQGILNLTGFAPPNPSRHYFGQRRLGVGLRDLYGRLILPSGAADGALREGGDVQSVSTDAPPPTEKLMSWFSGPVTLGPDGQAELSIPIPDFNGEIRVMAVVWSDRGVGQANATILSRDPVVMTVTAPAFLAPGDEAEIGLRLTHASGPAGSVSLSLTQTEGDLNGAEGVSVTLPPLQDNVTLTDKGEVRLRLPIVAGEETGPVEMRLTLTTSSGQELTKDLSLLVALNTPEIQRQDRLLIAPGNSITLPASLTQNMQPGANVSMAVGNYARLDVAGALARLERYPYGCTEQLTSIALPLLYLPRLSAIEDLGADTPTQNPVDDAIARILTRQGPNGSFGMWNAGSGDLWLDAYVTDFLSRARAMGHNVPDIGFRAALDNLRNRVNYATDPKAAAADDNSALAYAVAVLARERAVSIGDLRYYADTTPEAFSTPMAAAHIGAALAQSGDQQRADRMFRQAVAAADAISALPAENRSWRGDYGTHLRDRLALLALAAESRSEAVDLQRLTTGVAQSIAEQAERRDYRSTQELVWSVMAAEQLSRTPTALTLNNMPLTAPVATLPAGAALANPGDTPVEVTVTATGQPLSFPAAGGKGYVISRAYYTLEGEPVDVSQVTLGTRLVAVLTVQPDSPEGGRLLITDPLPAGFEIDNPNLLQAGDIRALDWLSAQPYADMAEFRQDRFAASLGWSGTEPFRFAYILRAVTAGTYQHPGASIEDMYRPEYRAWTDGGTVRITP